MGSELETARAKGLRGEILARLYDVYGSAVTLGTVRAMLKHKGYISDADVRRAVSYLDGAYITVEAGAGEYWEADVRLTRAGVNLVEGDGADAGVTVDG